MCTNEVEVQRSHFQELTDHLLPCHVETLEATPELARDISEKLAEGVDAKGVGHVDASVFAKHVAQRLNRYDDSDGLHRWVTYARGRDLALAMNCARGDSAAMHTFSVEYGPTITRIAGRFESGAISRDDLCQVVMEKLFVGARCKIDEYLGQGFLLNWVRVTAARACIDEVRRNPQQHREEPTATAQLVEKFSAEGSDGVELAFLKSEYRGHFREAFERAVASATVADRVLLRQSIVEGASIDQLARVYGKHRATIARHIDRAKQRLMEATRTELMRELAVDPGELDSIIRLIQSNFNVSVHRMLAESSTASDMEEAS